MQPVNIYFTVLKPKTGLVIKKGKEGVNFSQGYGFLLLTLKNKEDVS
jgi:hypothetical protein